MRDRRRDPVGSADYKAVRVRLQAGVVVDDRLSVRAGVAPQQDGGKPRHGVAPPRGVTERAAGTESNDVVGIGLAAETCDSRCRAVHGQATAGNDRVALASYQVIRVLLKRSILGDNRVAIGIGIATEQLG